MANPENSKLFEVEENKDERTNDENVSNLATDEVLQKDTGTALVDATNKTLKRKYKTNKDMKAKKTKASNKGNITTEEKQKKTGKKKVIKYSISSITVRNQLTSYSQYLYPH